MAIRFYQLKVATVRYNTASAVQIGVEIPEDKKEIFQFDPGQYLTISVDIDGQKVRRAYSICSAQHEPIISILTKRVDQGLVSNYLNDHVKVGDRYDILPPNGHFNLGLAEKESHQYFFFGAGSGITPLMSMIASLLENEPKANCSLYYANQDEDNIIFQKKIERLQFVYKNRLRVRKILSDPKKVELKNWKRFVQSPKIEWQGETGFLDKDKIENFLQKENNGAQKIAGYFICGPGPMIEVTYNSLLDLGINKALVHKEHFSAPTNTDTIIASSEREQITSKVKVILEEEQIDLTIDDDTNIIQALLNKNIDPPYSCLSGTCSTCMAKLEKGEVAMDVTIGLEDDEKEKGFILTCQSHPLTTEVTVNYDKLED